MAVDSHSLTTIAVRKILILSILALIWRTTVDMGCLALDAFEKVQQETCGIVSLDAKNAQQ